MEMISDNNNPFVQALVVSTVMAVFMIGVALGIMGMVTAESNRLPLPFPILLLIFAVIFITGSVFFEQRGADHIGSLIGGTIVAFSATFACASFFGGIMYALKGGITAIGMPQIISALAICMIASMVIVKLLQHKLQEHYI